MGLTVVEYSTVTVISPHVGIIQLMITGTICVDGKQAVGGSRSASTVSSSGSSSTFAAARAAASTVFCMRVLFAKRVTSIERETSYGENSEQSDSHDGYNNTALTRHSTAAKTHFLSS